MRSRMTSYNKGKIGLLKLINIRTKNSPYIKDDSPWYRTTDTETPSDTQRRRRVSCRGSTLYSIAGSPPASDAIHTSSAKIDIRGVEGNTEYSAGFTHMQGLVGMHI